MKVLFLSGIAGNLPATPIYLISIKSSRGAMLVLIKHTSLRDRVGDTMLIDTKKAATVMKNDASQNALPDDTAGNPELPETGIENNSKNIENNTKTTQNSAEKAFFDAKNPPKHSKTSPEVENSLKLLLDCGSIIRASTKIEKSAPHIYERCTKSDGKSISSALSVSYIQCRF